MRVLRYGLDGLVELAPVLLLSAVENGCGELHDPDVPPRFVHFGLAGGGGSLWLTPLEPLGATVVVVPPLELAALELAALALVALELLALEWPALEPLAKAVGTTKPSVRVTVDAMVTADPAHRLWMNMLRLLRRVSASRRGRFHCWLHSGSVTMPCPSFVASPNCVVSVTRRTPETRSLCGFFGRYDHI